jgi:hypothetical protein
MAGNGNIPVETILKLVLDKSSANDIKTFLDGHEQQWGRIEQTIANIGDSIEGIARYGMNLAGVAGVGAIASNFFNTSTYGSNLALASGRVTGGPGAWHPYGQALLGAQAKTGVNASEIAQGLIQAIQAVGGNPTPGQAAILGGLLAGYGQTVGLTPGQVSQIVAPLLQASNKSLTAGNILGMAATLSGGLTSMPGSQAAPMMGLLSQLGVMQALGSGPGGGFTMNLHGLTAAVNAAVQGNSIWRNPSITGGAINAISGGLQGAYQNPSLEAFMQMAGISYQSQRQGFTPQNMQSIMAEATRLYGTGRTRDIFLRSMFGLEGADLLEQFAPGSKSWTQLQHDLQHHTSPATTRRLIQHAQARTTPNALLNRGTGGILGWFESSLPHAVLGALAITQGPALLRKGLGGGLKALLGRGGGIALGDEAGAGAEGGILEALGIGAGGLASSVLGGGIGAILGSLADPAVAGETNPGSAKLGLLTALASMQGHDFKSKKQAEQYLRQQLGSKGYPAWAAATGFGVHPAGANTAEQLLQKLVSSPGWNQDPISTLAQAATKLLAAANKMSGPSAKGASYTGGVTAQDIGLLGTPGIQAMSSLAPGVEFAALTGGSSTGSVLAALGSGSGHSAFVSLPGSGGAPAGWQPCILTWYNPALGGINSGNGAANPNAATASGQPYSATAYTCAAPPAYAFGTQITFAYRGKQVTCVVNDRGGAITGSHFDLSIAAANAIGLTSSQPAGGGRGHFKVLSTSSTSSGSPGGSGGAGGSSPAGSGHTSFVSGLATAAAGSLAVPTSSGRVGGSQSAVINVNVDGRRMRQHRILLGHYS